MNYCIFKIIGCFLFFTSCSISPTTVNSKNVTQDSLFSARNLEEAKSNPSNVHKLILEGHEVLPELSSFPRLRTLILSNSKIANIPNDYFAISSLKKIIFRGKSVFPYGMQKFKNLEAIDFQLDEGNIYIPKTHVLPSLKYIRCYFNFPSGIRSLAPNLKSLGIYNSDLIGVQLSFPKLIYLELMECENELDILKDLSECSNVTSITIGISSISKLPLEVSKLNKLTEIKLDYLDIKHIPDFLFQMKSLKIINIWHCNNISSSLINEYSRLCQIKDIKLFIR